MYLLLDKKAVHIGVWIIFDQLQKRVTLALGGYPELSLADARCERDECKELLAQGLAPFVERKFAEDKAHAALKNTFEAVVLIYENRKGG